MRPSKAFKISLILIGSFLVCLILCFITGYVVDRASQSELNALKHASEGILEGSLYAGPDNAWLYYEEAIDIAAGIQLDSERERYTYGFIAITPAIERTMNENQEALQLLIAGAAQPHCSVLFDYRSKMFRHNTNLFRLKLVTQVLCARALSRLEHGETKQGMDDLLAALIIARHIAELSPSVLDHIGALNLLYWGLHVMNTAIASGTLSPGELASVSHFLDGLERDWPYLSGTLEKQAAGLKIYIANSSIATTSDLLLLPHHGREPSFLLRLLLRLRYWRSLFSSRRAFVTHFSSLDAVIASMKEIEVRSAAQGTWGAERGFTGGFQKEIALHHRKNHVPGIFTPQFTNTGLLFNLTKIRLLRCAAIVAAYRARHGQYPVNLSELEVRVRTDPNTGTMWEYKITDDTASLKSPGLNLQETYDDITVILTTRGIADYLSERRKAAGNG